LLPLKQTFQKIIFADAARKAADIFEETMKESGTQSVIGQGR